ncbi:hypothetical protein MBLNU459_g3100t1 [Dothideomycetes sp. NU459]
MEQTMETNCGTANHWPDNSSTATKTNYTAMETEYAISATFATSTGQMGHVDTKDFTPLNGTIHPVFEHGSWSNLSTQDYALLEPVIQLATVLLLEPCIFAFFNGQYGPNLKPLDNPAAAKALGQDLFWFEPNNAHMLPAFRAMLNMKDRVTWQFGDPDHKSWATTEGYAPPNARRDPVTHNPSYTTINSVITLRKEFLHVLQGRIDPGLAPRVGMECRPYDKQAAKMRSHLFMAVVMLHELCHAFENSTRERLPDWDRYADELIRNGANRAVEAFYRDYRIAEHGFAFEQYVFGGVLEVLGTGDCEVSHGLGTTTFPGIATQVGVSIKPKGDSADRLYGCKMNEVHRLFDRTWWDLNIQRFGIDAFRFDRTHDVWAQMIYGDAGIYKLV